MIRRIIRDLTTVAGAATATLDFAGTIIGVTSKPGSPAPTALWDMVLTDEFGKDLFKGLGADRSATLIEEFCPGIPLSDGTDSALMPLSHKGAATLSISGAGNGKAIKVIVSVSVSDYLSDDVG